MKKTEKETGREAKPGRQKQTVNVGGRDRQMRRRRKKKRLTEMKQSGCILDREPRKENGRKSTFSL